MRTLGPTLSLLLALLAAPRRASAFDCNGSLVEVGDNQFRVRSACGAPTTATSRNEVRSRMAPSPYRGGAMVMLRQSVRVEVWVYDFGPQRFVEELTFEDGVLVSTRSLGPGTSR